MKNVKIQKVDGETRVMLPEGVSAKDFEDWLNDVPHKKQLQFEELPERWTSAEWDDLEDK